jgi:ABC transporter substrate binding protein
VWPLATYAQQSTRKPWLCLLTCGPGTAQSPATRCEAFFQGLRELGDVNGQTINIDYLHPDGQAERFPALAADCVRQKPDIIAVTTTPGAQAVKKATSSTIPIVMVALGDPEAISWDLDLWTAWPGGGQSGKDRAARIELPVLLLRCPHLGSSHSRGSADVKGSWRAGCNERNPQALMKPWHRMTSAF